MLKGRKRLVTTESTRRLQQREYRLRSSQRQVTAVSGDQDLWPRDARVVRTELCAVPPAFRKHTDGAEIGRSP